MVEIRETMQNPRVLRLKAETDKNGRMKGHKVKGATGDKKVD